MKILILEDEELMADLLKTLVRGLYPDSDIFHARSITEALRRWRETHHDLVLSDLSLPDGNGLDFLRRAPVDGRVTPIVIITANPDRKSVQRAARYGVRGFISKPFEAELVHDRLQQILAGGKTTEPLTEQNGDSTEVPVLEEALHRAESGNLRLPTPVDLDALRDLRARADTLSLSELEKAWQDIPSLVTRLIDASNGSALRRTDTPNTSLRDALLVLGIPTALNLAMAMALDLTTTLQDPTLQTRARHYQEQSERMAHQAAALGRSLRADASLCFTAGLMHRLGELAVIATAQRCVLQGCTLDPAALDTALAGAWPARMAVALKSRLRLSLPLKQMIGAAHGFGLGSGHIQLPIMRTAFLLTNGAADSAECQKLLGRLGLSAPDTTGEMPSEQVSLQRNADW